MNEMIVSVGSLNKVKVEAVQNALMCYSPFMHARFIPIDVSSGVSEQPVGFEQIYLGAKNRAMDAWDLRRSEYGVGLESGLLAVPGEELPTMNIGVCVIYNGRDFNYGQSQGFPIPRKVANLIQNEGVTLEEALHRLGFTEQRRIGRGDGFVSILTDGRLKRQSYLEEAVHMAVIPTIKKDLFSQ